LAVCCQRAGVQDKKGDALYQHLATKFGGVPTKDQMGNYWKLRGDDPVGVEYAMGDGVSTWALWQYQVEALRREDMDGIRRLESAVTRVVYRMMRRGVPIDRERLTAVHREAEAMVLRAREALPPDFNVLAPSQIEKLLRDNGITNWPMTAPSKTFKNGKPQFNEAFLVTNEPGRRIIAVRKYEHMIDTFIKPMMERHIWDDGCCHSTFNQARSDEFGTVTGRFSSNEPNLQQVPKRNKEIGSLVRSFFVPFDGEIWADADLSQCEPRILAHYSGAKVLTEGYMSVPFVDAHQAVANAASIDREDGKRLNQTLITGGGKGKIVAMLGARGAGVYDAYFEALPEIKTLQKNSSRRMETRGYVISMLKRRARLESRDKSYKAMNRLLQCGNADVVKLAMVRIDNYFEKNGDNVKILNTVHDALGFSVPDDDDCKRQYDHAMRLFTDFGPGRSVEMRVPMAAEYAYGANWAEASYPKKGDKITVGADPADPWYIENKVPMEDLW
jgi:DNA polymerase I-like protein with 3'-5' exonuclease and polymerase domains